MNKLKALRNEIDVIDDELVKLLERRFDLTAEIGNLKKNLDDEILDISREKDIVKRIIEKLENLDYDEYIINIFVEILGQSKEQQKEIREMTD